MCGDRYETSTSETKWRDCVKFSVSATDQDMITAAKSIHWGNSEELGEWIPALFVQIVKCEEHLAHISAVPIDNRRTLRRDRSTCGSAGNSRATSRCTVSSGHASVDERWKARIGVSGDSSPARVRRQRDDETAAGQPAQLFITIDDHESGSVPGPRRPPQFGRQSTLASL